MPTIRDVARLAGCSTATVSRFFNQKPVSRDIERRVVAAIEALAFSPNVVARNLKLKKSMILGMVVPDITNAFFPEVVRGAEDVARGKGYSLMLFNTQEDPERESRCIEILVSHQCDGIVLVKAEKGPSVERRRDRLATLPLPLVYLDRAPDQSRDAVLLDNTRGARRAVEHLLKLEHRKIAIVMTRGISTHAERYAGYRRALEESGLAARTDYVVETDAEVEDAFSATLRLMASADPPTAIFATNARLTIGVMAAVHARGLRCPDDVSILGHDGSDWQTAFKPGLTIVDQPALRMGRMAAEMLIQRITGALDGPPRRVILNPDLVVRESCGVYRGGLRAPGAAGASAPGAANGSAPADTTPGR
jgi:DNA-binding LacI/PurR family transcriptional regulator